MRVSLPALLLPICLALGALASNEAVAEEAVALAIEPAIPEGLDADEIVRRAEDALRGDTAHMKMTMKITTPRWKRELSMRSWDDRHNDRSFIRILAPQKDRGTGFLHIGNTMWTYLPRVERTTRIPPSMMLQPWMGSDFTNDDLARDSSLIDDYTPRYLGQREIEGQLAYGVELIPKEDAPVVWSKIEAWVVAENFAPLLYEYYDEPDPGVFEAIRRMHFSDVRDVKGRPLPHYWLMKPLDKPGHTTEITLEEAVLDEPLAEEIFTHANLKRAEAVR